MFWYHHVILNSFYQLFIILLIYKWTGGYIYQQVPGEFHFASSCSEEENKGQANCNTLCFTSKHNKHSLIVAIAQEIWSKSKPGTKSVLPMCLLVLQLLLRHVSLNFILERLSHWATSYFSKRKNPNNYDLN